MLRLTDGLQPSSRTTWRWRCTRMAWWTSTLWRPHQAARKQAMVVRIFQYKSTLIKKKIKFSSYIRKFRSGTVAKSCIRKGFLIYEEMCKCFPIYEEAFSHIWVCNCSILNFLIYEENFILFFISVHVHNRHTSCCFCHDDYCHFMTMARVLYELTVLNKRICFMSISFAHTLYSLNQHQKLQQQKNIPRKGIAQPQYQFPHSYVCERFIYSYYRSAYSAAGNMWTDPWNI